MAGGPEDPPNVVPIRGVPDAVIIDPKAPLEIARTFIHRHHTSDKFRAVHHQQSVFSIWTGTHYRELLTEEMRARIYAFLEDSFVMVKNQPKPFRPTARAVSDVLDAARAAAQLDNTIRQPSWLSPSSYPADEIIACRNGLLHLPSGQVLQHTPNFYANNSLGYSFNPTASAPTEWLKFLDTIWPESPLEVGTLQEIFGYLLGTDTDQQKIIMMVGPKRSGKGTIGRILAHLLGGDAIVSPTLASLQGNFGLQPLIGRRVAMIADARLSGRADQQAVAERLLSISGEDMQTVERKHIGAWTGKLGTRFLILTNELPRISDASGALASRFLVLTMTNSFYGKEDHNLFSRLIPELPGILNWAIDGWRNLRERTRFVQPPSSADAVRELEDLSSPVSAFLRERCVISTRKETDIDVFYNEWCSWCDDQGRDFSGNKQSLGRDLKSIVPHVKTVQHNDDAGKMRRWYDGIGLLK